MDTALFVLADLILSGGVVVLKADGPAVAEAVAVTRGRVIAVGAAADVAKLKGTRTRVVDLRGATVLPGLIDAHAHVVSLARSLHDYVDLRGAESFEEVIRRVVAKAKTTKPGAWVLGRGWDQNLWGGARDLPHHDALSKATPEHPVFLRRVDGHAVLLNAEGLSRVGMPARLARTTPDPPGGRILKDADGRPTGVLLDTAMEVALAKVPQVAGEALRALVKRAMARIAAAGLTEVHEMGVGEADLSVLRKMADAGELTARLVVYVDGEDDATLRAQEARGPEVGLAGGMLTVRGAKFFTDGALGSRGAALIQPYSDDATNSGILMRDKESLAKAVGRATRARLQVAVHAIGDRANRVVIEALEAQADPKPERPRVEHAQVVHADDFKRLKAVGAVASMQPTHCTSDMPWAPKRLGPNRLGGAYAWRSMIEAGVPLAFGSDFPVEAVEPIRGLVAATLRSDDDGFPAGGWNPWQRLSASQTLAAFSSGAAFAAFEETQAGEVAVGKRADFTVVSGNPLAMSAADLRDLRVMMTVVDGRIVFENMSGE